MGTRNLTVVYLDGVHRIAQYGQWDGYPECGGVEALVFARKLQEPSFRERFERNVRQCRFITKEESVEIDRKILSKELGDWTKVYPQLSRDVGRGILDMVYNSDGGLVLGDSISFAADSMFCEWAWVIDLDHNLFEAYKGFNTDTPLTENDRFYNLPMQEYESTSDTYYPIKKVGEWTLDNLPSDEEFLDYFKTDESDEEDYV